jgi:hypothetical protein
MTFKGTIDGQEIGGKANVMLWSVAEFNDRLIQVNLSMNDGTYATFGWLPWDTTSFPSVGFVPAATALQVHFKLT